MRRPTAGFSAVEILISISILALACVPVLTMMSSGTRESFQNEFHLIAETRAESLVQTLAARDFQVFSSFPPGTPSVVPEALTTMVLEVPEQYRRKLANFEETVTVTPFGDGLVELAVEIGWVMPDEAAGGTHRFRLRRLVGKPDVGLSASYVPRQEGAR